MSSLTMNIKFKYPNPKRIEKVIGMLIDYSESEQNDETEKDLIQKLATIGQDASSLFASTRDWHVSDYQHKDNAHRLLWEYPPSFAWQDTITPFLNTL